VRSPGGPHNAWPWAVSTETGAVDTVISPTYRSFAMTQSHWFRAEAGRIVEHRANRDDLRTARQPGWIPRRRPTWHDGAGQAPAQKVITTFPDVPRSASR
jgi:hypothetical protein